jgi:predicted Zn-dependent protease
VALDRTQPSGHIAHPPLPPAGEPDEQEREFFVSPGVSAHPPEPPEEELAVPAEPESIEVLQRRLFFRKAVSAFLGMAAPLLLAVGIKGFTKRPAPPEAFTSAAAQQLSLITEAQAASRPVFQATAEPPASPPAAEQPLPVPAASSAASPPAAPPEPPAEAAPRPDPAQARELTRQALSLLERGSYKAAIEKATASLDADPTDASPYLYAGTALMELGKLKEAKVLFARCVENATRGPRHECRQFR